MIRIGRRLPLVSTIALAASCLGTALPAHAGASAVIGHVYNNVFTPLSGDASGALSVLVSFIPPEGRHALTMGCWEMRVIDKWGTHTTTGSPIPGDTVIVPGGMGRVYPWLSQSGPNGSVTIELDGSATTGGKGGSSVTPFTVSCSTTAKNIIVSDVTNDSCLFPWGLMAFTPASPTQTLTVEFQDSPGPRVQVTDKGDVHLRLLHLGPNGLGSLAWSADYTNIDLGQTLELSLPVTDGTTGPVVYAPQACAQQVDQDAHQWYSTRVHVRGLSTERVEVTGTRTMSLNVTHTNVLSDAAPPSGVWVSVFSSSPLGSIVDGDLSTAAGEQTDLLTDVGPLTASGTYWLAVGGSDGHGSVSKYAGNVEHKIAPAMVSFTIPSATCIAGDDYGGGPYAFARARAQSQYESLGCIAPPSGSPSLGCLYSARYEYGQGWRGGYQDRPSKAHTLEVLFDDSVVTFNGHGGPMTIQNRENDYVSVADVEAYATAEGDSAARFVLLQCCGAGQLLLPALRAAGVDCVVGHKMSTYPTDPGWPRLMAKMCMEAKTAQVAFWETYWATPEWQMSGATIDGDTQLWGVPL